MADRGLPLSAQAAQSMPRFSVARACYGVEKTGALDAQCSRSSSYRPSVLPGLIYEVKRRTFCHRYHQGSITTSLADDNFLY
ncbi:hypothetical protein KCP76_08150 [Salmonella enterica subsp. enterica serovar Weltevreden]|nr:hypothetical protein KCP76_08150 [Salmonella enterica subsp. enterica serovar Weltevreden]